MIFPLTALAANAAYTCDLPNILSTVLPIAFKLYAFTNKCNNPPCKNADVKSR
jgi:hypothetical protein